MSLIERMFWALAFIDRRDSLAPALLWKSRETSGQLSMRDRHDKVEGRRSLVNEQTLKGFDIHVENQ